MPEEKPPYTVAFEANNGDLAEIRNFISQIELTDDVSRFRIEISSQTPVLDFATESTEEETQEETEAEAQEEPKDEAENGFKKFDNEGTKVLSHNEGECDPKVGTYNIGTHRWKIAAFLYRQNEPLQLSHIEAFLEGTEWEIGYKSLSATLSKMKSDNLVSKEPLPATSHKGYTLSEKGEKRMRNTVDQEDNYILTMADKIAGLHPTNSYETPDLEA